MLPLPLPGQSAPHRTALAVPPLLRLPALSSLCKQSIKSSVPSQSQATARCLTRIPCPYHPCPAMPCHATPRCQSVATAHNKSEVRRSPIAPNSHSRTICGIVRYMALTQRHLHTHKHTHTHGQCSGRPTHTHTESLLSFSHVASSMQTTFCRNSSFLGLRFIFMADPYLLWD